ncbi:MAG: putative Ig domain-containing protein, partial [Kiritimatiellae bacterium]|nr:putative Ig domain-containing protein [Kiritimatiellia bacterium]
ETRYVFALFATKEDDADSLKVAVEDVTTEKDGTIALDLGACVASLSLPKLAVSGLPTGLKYDAKTLKVVGKATKPGVYTVTVKATNASVTRAADATTATFKITVPNFECEALPGLESETDAYGTIHAGVKFGPGLIDCTPADGWTVKAAGLPAGLKFAAKETKDATYGVVPAWTIYGVPTAKAGAYTVTFTASKKGEKNQVATITLNVEALPAWAVGTFDGVIMDGESTDEMSVDPVNGQDACSPCGIVSLAVAANGKISWRLMMDGETWKVSGVAFETICEWRIPYNNGHVGGEAGLWRPGDTGRSFGATVVAKYGKSVATNYVEVSETRFADEMSETGYRTRGVATARSASTPSQDSVPVEWTAWQNLWKTEPWKSEAKAFAKAPVLTMDAGTWDACPYPGTITLKFATTGAVTASGKFVTGQDAKGKDIVYSASCSSVLIPDGDGVRISPEQSEHCEAMSLEACAPALPDALDFRVFLYFAPKAGKFDGFADEIPLIWDGAGFSPE